MPDFDYWLQYAKELSTKSNCKKSRFGAAILSPRGEFLGEGYNHSIVPNLCCMREDVRHGRELERCGAVHAEQAAAIDALRKDRDIEGASIVVWGSRWDGRVFYCSFCARILAEAGVKYVVSKAETKHLKEAIEDAYSVALLSS